MSAERPHPFPPPVGEGASASQRQPDVAPGVLAVAPCPDCAEVPDEGADPCATDVELPSVEPLLLPVAGAVPTALEPLYRTYRELAMLRGGDRWEAPAMVPCTVH